MCAAGVLLALAATPDTRAESDAEKLELGRAVFTRLAEPQCRVCHALGDIEAVAQIGADFEELQPDEQRVAQAVRGGIGIMPAYRGKLTEDEIAAVAYFVARAARDAKSGAKR